MSIRCNLCGADDARPVAEERGFCIVRCRQCALVYVNPQPVLVAGEDVEFHKGTDAAERPGFSAAKAAVYEGGLDRLAELVPDKGTVLDVGCGFGHFLAAARDRGWSPVGIDVSPVSLDFARTQLGLEELHRGDLAGRFPDGAFDAATMWNLLEHVPDPDATLREVARVLRPGGVVLVRVPNMVVHEAIRRTRPVSAWGLRALGRRVPPYLGGIAPPQHLFGFTPRTATALLRRAGFEVEGVEPAVSHEQGTTAGKVSGTVARTAFRASPRLVLSPAFVAVGRKPR